MNRNQPNRRYPPPSDPWTQNQPGPVNWPAQQPGEQQPGAQYPGDPRYPYPPQYNWQQPPPEWSRPVRRRRGCGCSCGCLPLFVLAAIVLGIGLTGYLLFPGRMNVLLLGIDYATPGNSVARSDTLILSTFIPSEPYIGLLSIPRDLWVPIAGVGENRINTAHFFAEINQPGSGPHATMDTIRQNFGVDVDYYARIRFEGVRELVNALGGVDVQLDEPLAGYPAGVVHLNGNKALAFARNRSGSDDFFRMQQGQILIKSIIKEALRPRSWPRLPAVALAALDSIETNVPIWQWPRLGVALLRLGPDGIDNRTITREMVTPTTTSEGANVLVPNWNQINPILMEIFGQ